MECGRGDGASDEDGKGSRSREEGQESAAERRMARLLIVDDDKNIRHTLSLLVEAMGHEALVAESGTAAIAMLAREHVDLVVTDFRMGEVDGLEVLRRARGLTPKVG